MKFNILPSSVFERELKKIAKKHKGVKYDFLELGKELLENPNLGTDLGNGLRKIRVGIKSSNISKRKGLRVITLNEVIILNKEGTIHLLTVYAKNDKESITDSELKELIKEVETES